MGEQVERGYRELFEHSAVGMAEVTLQGVFRRVNKMFCQMMACAEKDLLGLRFQDITHPDDLEEDIRLVEDLVTGVRDRYELEKRYVRFDNSFIWIHLSVAVVRDEAGSPLYFVSTIVDISQRRAGELRLRVLSEAVEQSPVSIVITDPQGGIEYVNPMFCQVTGYGKEEVLGKNPRILSSGKMNKAFYRKLWQTVTSRKIWQGEFVNRRRDGVEYWEKASISPIVDEQGRILHYVGVKEDVTERKRNIDEREHLLAALERRVRALQCLTTISNAIQQKEKLEDLFWEVLRILPEGWRYPALVHLVYDGVDYAYPGFLQTADRLRAALKVGEATRGWVEIVYPQEHPRAYEGPFLREERELLETVARMLGQSLRRRESEAKLEQAREAAMEANRAKSLFLSNMSHEIRTPLNAILGFSEILYRDAAMGREQREKLQIVNRSGAYLLALINDVLELAKVESGRVVLQNSLFDLRRLVRDMGSLFQVRLDQKGLQLLLEIVEPLPEQVKGDEGRIRRILVNLIGNALKFTDRGVINVRLAGKSLGDGQWRLQVTVKDSGIGIAAEDQEAIFGYFEQAYHQRHDRGGTGLGLAISREFARAMAGDISVSSRPGEGAEFLVTLLLEEGTQQETAIPRSELVAGLLPGQQAYRILVAMSVETDALLLQAMLEQAGFLAIAVAGKEELLQESARGADLIFADLALLQTEEYWLVRELQQRSSRCDLPIIAVSAGLGADEVQQVLLQQVRAVLSKPFTTEQVLNMAAAQTGAQYAYQELEKTSPATWQGRCYLENPLRESLLAATLDGDIERLEELLVQVEVKEPGLAAYARELAGAFRLDALAALWEQGEESRDGTKS